MSCGWIIYLTYYNSRNIGLILTLIINRLYKNGYIHIGEFASILLFKKKKCHDRFFVFIYLFIFQVHFHSLCCLARSCFEMSISSIKTCRSGTQHRVCVEHFLIVYWLYPMFIYSIGDFFLSRIQDGLLIFRWWKMYNPKQKQHGQCKSITNNPHKL